MGVSERDWYRIDGRPAGGKKAPPGWLGVVLVVLLIAATRWSGSMPDLFGTSSTDDRIGVGEGDVASAEPPPAAETELEARHYEVGDCVTWDEGDPLARAQDTDVVDCADPHRIEISGSVDVADLGSGYPSDATWDSVYFERCRAANEALIGGAIDPYGIVSPVGIQPLPDSWAAGERTVWCGLSADRTSTFSEFQGTVIGISQQVVHPPGTCLDMGRSEPVDCAIAHEVEITGAVTLPDGLVLPGVDDHDGWRALVGAQCGAASEAYVGGSYPVGFGPGHLYVEQPTYDAGGRALHCFVARWQDDEIMGATGSVRAG